MILSAAAAAGLRAKVALVERHLMGGDCLNYGCVPSKGIIRAGRAAAAVRDAEQFGVNVGGDCTVDFAAAMLALWWTTTSNSNWPTHFAPVWMCASG